MIIKIIPPDETKELITICPRSNDEVIINECGGFGIPTKIGLYNICMRNGGLEIRLTPHGEYQAKLISSVDEALSVCSWEIQQAHKKTLS